MQDQGSFQAALVVPIYNESLVNIQRLVTHAEHNETLLIAVVNAPDNASNEKFEIAKGLLNQCQNLEKTNLIVLDHVSQPLPRQQGVGLARKIGCDYALYLYANGIVRSPWIYTSDTDATLPTNYFTHPLNPFGAHVFAHHHVVADANNESLQTAIDLYDQHMAYYVAGLTYAGSRYAYPTLGSTITVHANTYAQVRGFPKRNAAEDFYLLNKVAKISTVQYTPEVCIDIEARLSERVPFGTGPALAKIIDNSGPFLSYDFRAFELLRTTLAALDEFATTGRLNLDISTHAILDALGWHSRVQRFVDKYEPRQRLGVVHDWFDALKTLQFMHHAADLYPTKPLLETMELLPSDVLYTLNRHYRRDRVLN